MGQHRTRQQKEHAQKHRIVQSATGLYSLSAGSVSAPKSRIQSVKMIEDRALILKDLRKTLFVCLYVLALLLVLWWKLR